MSRPPRRAPESADQLGVASPVGSTTRSMVREESWTPRCSRPRSGGELLGKVRRIDRRDAGHPSRIELEAMESAQGGGVLILPAAGSRSTDSSRAPPRPGRGHAGPPGQRRALQPAPRRARPSCPGRVRGRRAPVRSSPGPTPSAGARPSGDRDGRRHQGSVPEGKGILEIVGMQQISLAHRARPRLRRGGRWPRSPPRARGRRGRRRSSRRQSRGAREPRRGKTDGPVTPLSTPVTAHLSPSTATASPALRASPCDSLDPAVYALNAPRMIEKRSRQRIGIPETSVHPWPLARQAGMARMRARCPRARSPESPVPRRRTRGPGPPPGRERLQARADGSRLECRGRRAAPAASAPARLRRCRR